MKSGTRRWLSIAMLALLVLTQATLVFAACTVERGQLAGMLAATDDHDCCPDGADERTAMSANTCVALTTADLQVAGAPAAIFVAFAGQPMLLLPRDAGRSAPPPSRPVRWDPVPPRILLHSFLI